MVDTSVTYAAYMALSTDEQAAKKSAPGYWLPAVFKDGRRKQDHLIRRTAIVLDLDYVTPEQLESIRNGDAPINAFYWFMHTSRAHCPEKPRVRIVVYLDREVDPTEANALTRYLAQLLAADPDEGIEIPDIVSMRKNQAMFLPSVSRGQEFWFDRSASDDLVDVDEFLAARPGWDDYSQLPYQEREKDRRADAPGRKMEDPRKKEGVIGAFCRVYGVEDVIAEFLPDVYVPGDCDTEIRYTYALGSGSNGAVVYDNGLFLHSHHGSDPIDGQVNAWDLARIHLFGHLDREARANTTLSNLPSSKAMREFARKDPKVRKELLDEVAPVDEWDDDDAGLPETDDDLLGPPPKKKARVDDDDLLGPPPKKARDIADEFDDDEGGDEDEESAKPKKDKAKKGKAKPDWRNWLVLDQHNRIEGGLHNCVTIAKNDPRVAPCIGVNDLDGGPYLLKPLKFPKAGLRQARVPSDGSGRRWTDNDSAALMSALAAPVEMGGYGTQFTRQDVELALLQTSEQNRYNPFLDKVRAVSWDGVERLATFFHDWLRTDDTAYHTELATIWFVAGITRQYEPGHVFDLVPILGGAQGGGKTGAIRELGMGHGGTLAGDFHSTQKMTEATKGKVVLEVPELKGLSRAQIEDVKHYFTETQDTVRLAYRRNEEDFLRRCVYMGTTNEDYYLRDTENRRFCPVLTRTSLAHKIDFPNFKPLVQQFWAEAHHIYLEMRRKQPSGMLPLHFTSPEAQAEALRLQSEARETLPHEPVQEVVERWLNTPLTAHEVQSALGGHQIDAEFDDDDEGGDSPRYVRNLVTVTEIRENLANNPIIRELRGGYADKTIGQALKSMSAWERLGYVHRLGRKARWYCRVGESGHDPFIPAPPPRKNNDDDLLS